MKSLSCPEARSLLSDYIDGELEPSVSRALEEHLQTCPNCPPLYASLVETLAELRNLGDERGVEKLVHTVVQSISEEGGGRRRKDHASDGD